MYGTVRGYLVYELASSHRSPPADPRPLPPQMDRCRLYPHRREGCRYLDQSPLERLRQRRHLLGNHGTSPSSEPSMFTEIPHARKDFAMSSDVGHVPRELSSKVYHFLRHGGRATCEVAGRRKRGNGLEVPCVYRFVAKRCRLVKKLRVLLQGQPSANSWSVKER